MTTSFIIEVSVTGLVILLVLLYRFIELFRQLVDLLREMWEDIKNE